MVSKCTEESNTDNIRYMVANDVQKNVKKEQWEIKIMDLEREVAEKNTEIMKLRHELKHKCAEVQDLDNRLTS